MLPISRRHAHYVFAVMQSGLTTGVATGVASLPFWSKGFFLHWLLAWLGSWVVMLPIVIGAAPLLRRLAHRITRDETPPLPADIAPPPG